VDTAQTAPKTVILAGDEASLYLQATLQVVWAPRGQTPIVKLHPSRESTHFYGALDLQSGQELAMRSPIMNAETSALFLQKILLVSPDDPILLLWDRAPWHRGPEIEAVLEANPRLEVMYLPAGAPDLNPQEQVWKATREEVSHNHSCQQLDLLASEFEAHLTTNSFPCSLLENHGYTKLCMMFK
jgi:putative transposase